MADFILDAGHSDPLELGGKAWALARLAGADLPIPPWFVVGPAALAACLNLAQQEMLAQAGDAAAAQAALADLTLDGAVLAQLQRALDAFPAHVCFAVRSSARDEDSESHSFAGQLESYLNVPRAEVPAHVVKVWQSGFGERVYAYRREHGLSLPPAAPAVLVQQMVPAQQAGVAFSADPVSGRRGVAVVAAVPGLGEDLVSGAQDADSYQVDRDGAIRRRALVDPAAPVLTHAQARAVAALARQAADHFGRPQDMEWAMAGDALYLLQSRPITTLAATPDPDAPAILWDNSNIVESYGGVTTPLTYSFARRAYQAVYQEFCRILGVPEARIAANAHVFACMIGLIRGRIYYNLLNWYRVLALLPGFRTNRRFMEQMMGVGEALPAAMVEELAAELNMAGGGSLGQRLADRIRLAGALAGLVRGLLGLERRKRAFYARLEEALGATRPDLSTLRADELAAYYRTLDRQLLTHWDAPLINDFFAMIFYGLLRTLAERWCGDQAGTLQNDLLAGQGGMVSAEPALRLHEMAELVRATDDDGALARLLQEGAPAAVQAAMPEPLRDAYTRYLARFGDRCADELKLESLTLLDDPRPLLAAVGRLAAHPPADGRSDVGAVLRAQAQERVDRVLAGKPLKRRIFGWVLANARRTVRDRENLRFERTRVFGRARHIFTELGKRFYAADRLDAPRDIFYLEMDEILGFVDGTATTTDLRGLVAVRRAEYAGYAAEPPPGRFTTLGMVHVGNDFLPPADAPAASAGETLRGTGACPGRVRGRVRVVCDPLAATLAPGDILVAERTDPSWILIMPAAAGILVERGSLLSHTAIVARELGIPSVVGLAGITRLLQDGDQVEFDGATGVVTRLTADGTELRG